MPNIKSAAKRIRSDAKKRARNQRALSELKTLKQRLHSLASEPAKAEALAVSVVSRYDRAVSRGLIPRGRGDRNKSRIAAFLAKIRRS